MAAICSGCCGADTGGADTDGSMNVVFGIVNDQNGLFDSLLIPGGGSRTFIMTANTNNAFDAKTTGSVSVSGKITGSTGWDSTTNNWNTGNFGYFYTPAGSRASETSALSHSDSYDVIGPTLTHVVSEAAVDGVPLLASRIAGTVGLLGRGYRGYFEPKDTAGLRALLLRAEREPAFLEGLRRSVIAKAPLFDERRERAAWAALLRELGARPR